MLRGELASGEWYAAIAAAEPCRKLLVCRSQQLHHLTPICLPDDRFMKLLRDCNIPVEIVDTGRKVSGYVYPRYRAARVP